MAIFQLNEMNENTYELRLYELKQRMFWFINGIGIHGLSWKLFRNLSTQRLCELYNVEPQFFKPKQESYKNMKRYAIFQMNANGQGGYHLCKMVTRIDPTEDKQKAVEFCKKMNEYKPDSWHYFQVFEINENNQPLSWNSGEVIHH